MDVEEARGRFVASPTATLATVRPDGTPHLVPIVFAADGDTLYMAVDQKPKRTRKLQRLENLRSQPRCSLLVDHYEDDWDRLWWVRADGHAEVIDEPDPEHPGLALLADRYAAYAASRPPGALVVITVALWRGWSATA